ncbi:MAG: transketolase C-terminal domain-containing protein [Pseudorhodoplanes sp.]|jgi:pyruvate dehydrogenase E1 component beta subunit|nr:transketolase C-terminal domain-containing protein [Pseudorhodoplanes sp.]
MRKISYAAAIVEALRQSLIEDSNVSLVGSYVLGLGPKRVLMDQIRDEFSDRIFDPPTSEAAIISLGAGAAMAGARPFVDIGTASFTYVGWSPLVNEAAVACYMSGGNQRVPVVYHMLHGLRIGGAAQHSHSPQAMLWNAPGLEIVLPSSPYDVKGLIRSAIKSNNPTILVDHARLMDIEGEVPEHDYEIPFGRGDIKRPGRDVTVIATSYIVQTALTAAAQLANEGIDVEVVDPRTLVPLDRDLILDSVGRTGRLVVADETYLSCGVASELAAIVVEHGFKSLRAPIIRVARPDIPTPFSRPLEEAITPTAEKICAAVREVLVWN